MAEIRCEPPLNIPAKARSMVEFQIPQGRASVEVRCSITNALIESRPDCEVIQISPDEFVIVAAPGSVQKPKLTRLVRLRRWLAMSFLGYRRIWAEKIKF